MLVETSVSFSFRNAAFGDSAAGLLHFGNTIFMSKGD